MAKSTVKAFVSINGTDITEYVVSHNLPLEREPKDATSMADGTRVNLLGLHNWSLELELLQDFADGELDEILFDAFNNGTNILWIIRPDKDAAVGPNNPNYTGNGYIVSYPPVSGPVGELRKTTVRIVPNGPVSRLVA